MLPKLERLIWITLFFFVVFFVFLKGQSPNIGASLTLPSLPRPIAKEVVLITSAGQSTDTYIVKDIANGLKIHNYFMPQASTLDLEGIQSLCIVIGYSETSEKLHDFSFETEKERVSNLITLAEKENLPIIAVYIGGKHRRGAQTDALISLVVSHADYFIATVESNYDDFLMTLSREHQLPMTLVKQIANLSEPLASVYR